MILLLFELIKSQSALHYSNSNFDELEEQIFSLERILGFDEANIVGYDQLVVKNQSTFMLHKLNDLNDISLKEKERMRELILMARNILSDYKKKETYLLVSSIIKAEQSLLAYYADNKNEYFEILKKIEDKDLKNLDPRDFHRFPEIFSNDGPGKTYEQKSAAKNYKGVTSLSEQNLNKIFEEYEFKEYQKEVCKKIKIILDQLINQEERGIVQKSQNKKLFTCYNVLKVGTNQVQTRIISNTSQKLKQLSSSSLDNKSNHKMMEVQLAYATLIDTKKFKIYKFINEIIEGSPSLKIYFIAIGGLIGFLCLIKKIDKDHNAREREKQRLLEIERQKEEELKKKQSQSWFGGFFK
ncbi:UNKNOWN [Stylonychia lemnae]|uniref:Uncharacterized protein n=1 Tax=Stylonychia lemnae TaxID=5949 RepID=A0A078BAC7_STYLE|nr:UNKNOWN [Stylonychia lemnae]|eukprot:CDW90217.1 UNKNOWN [Stylonychia lemnae]